MEQAAPRQGWPGSQRALWSRRRLLAAGSGAPLALALAVACGPQATAPARTAPSAPSGTVVWLVRNNANENQWQTAVVIPALKQRYPALTVQLDVTSSNYLEKFTSMLAAGSPPDVFTAYVVGFPDYHFLDGPGDISAYIARDKIDLEVYLPNVKEIITTVYRPDGRVRALPILTTHAAFVFYNRDLLEQAGLPPPPADWEDRSWTWDKMVEYGRVLTKQPGTPEAVYGVRFGLASPEVPAWLFGGSPYLPEHYRQGWATRSVLDSTGVIDGLQAVQDLMWKHQVMPTPAEQRALSSLGDLFRAGRVAMQLGIGSGFWNYSNLTAFRWGVAAVPRARDNKVGAYVDPWMIAAKSANPEGAWALLKYITGDEGQRAYVASIGTPPVTRGAHQEWLKRFEPALKATDIAKVTEGADRHSQLVASHTFIRLAEMTPILNPEIEAVNENRSTPGDAVRRAKPPLDQKIAEIAQAVQAKYGRK